MRVFLTGKFVFKQTDGQNKAENAGSGGNSSDCQIGVPLACGGLVLYDCYTQVSIATPQVRAGVSKKKRHCVYSAVMVVGSTGLVRSGATEYSRGVFAWRSGKRRRKGIAISNRHCVCSWRRRQVGWLIRLLHASVNRVTAGESWRKQKKRHCVYSAVMVVGSTGLEPVTPCL